MADISQIKILDGTTYNIKDSTARTDAPKVTQTVKTDNVEYPILAKATNATTTITDTSTFSAGVTVNPSTKTITSGKLKVTNGSASKNCALVYDDSLEVLNFVFT